MFKKRNLKRILVLHKKVKSKNSFQCWFAECTLSKDSGPTKFLPQEPHSASQHQAVTAVNCV